MLRQHEHDLRAAKARRKVMCRRAEVSRTSGIHGTAAARFGGTIDQASSTECAQHIHPRPGSYAPEGQDRPSFAWSSTYFMSSSFVSVVNEPGQSTPALAPLLALRAVSDRQDFRPLRGGPRVRLQLVLGDDRAEVSRDDLERLEHRPQCEELGVVLRALAVVAATRILGWKMSDDTPTPAAGCSGIEVDGRCQLVVATVAHVAQADARQRPRNREQARNQVWRRTYALSRRRSFSIPAPVLSTAISPRHGRHRTRTGTAGDAVIPLPAGLPSGRDSTLATATRSRS